MLSDSFLAEQKKRLLEEKKRIEEKLSGMARKIPGMEEEWEPIVPPLQERSQEEMEDRFELIQELHSLEDVLEERLRRIKRALERIERGDYGVCENCAAPIEKERLEIEPAALLCSKCASSQE